MTKEIKETIEGLENIKSCVNQNMIAERNFSLFVPKHKELLSHTIEILNNLPTKEELEEIIASRLDCPDCDNTGAIEPDGDQCEFCHREENSKFNLAQAIHNRINE